MWRPVHWRDVCCLPLWCATGFGDRSGKRALGRAIASGFFGDSGRGLDARADPDSLGEGMMIPFEMMLPMTVIAPSRGLYRLDLHALWGHRELVYFLVWRDVK